METRKSIGERMLERLDRSDRYGRFARLGSGSQLGSYLFPDDVTAFPQRDQRHDMTHLSAAPYWDRIHRLGSARLRRQQRLFSLSERATQKRQMTAFRRLPDLKKRTAPLFGFVPFGSESFEVLAPLPVPVESAAEDSSVATPAPGSSPWVGAQRSTSPWHTGSEYRSARIATRRASRPIERAADRAPLPPDAVATLKRSVPADDLPSGESRQRRAVAQRTGRALRRSASPTRSMAVDIEAALPDDFLPPTRHAQGRMASRKGRRRGLRAALSSSPLMAALEPEGAHKEALTSPRRRTTLRPIGRSIGHTASRRVAHRAQPADAVLLSASPVHTPATVSPAVLTAHQMPRSSVAPSPTLEASPGGRGGSSRGDAGPQIKRTKTAPMVRALDRLEAAPPRLEERPLSARAPVASRPVKTRSGVFAPEVSVLLPGVQATDVTADAAPSVARPQAERRSKAATAMQRHFSGGMEESRFVSRRNDDELLASGGGTDRMGSQAGERTTSVLRRRPNRVVRDAERNAFVAESAVTVETGSSIGSRSSATVERMMRQPSEADASPQTAAERVSARGVQPGGRSGRRMAVAEVGDAAVLNPISVALEDVQEMPQGQHALHRNQRAPIVGETATKALVQLSRKATAPSRGSSESPSRTTSESSRKGRSARPVSPRRFRSPLSHVQLRRSPSVPRVTSPGTITLKSSPEQAITGDVDDRQARQSALGRVEQAWARSGRPLDWTDARIEVIQVPMATAEVAEPPRAMRSPSGAYIPSGSAPTRVTQAPTTFRSDRDPTNATRRPSRAANTQAASATVLAAPGRGREDMDSGIPSTPASGADPQPMAMAPTPRRRTGFDATVSGVGTGQVEPSMPIWAQRATGRPRITGGDDLVQQLARAAAPEDVVSVLMDQSDSVRRATSSLPTPVVQVIQQIKTESVRAENEAQAAQQASVQQAETVRQRSQRREGVRSTTRVVRGMTGLNPRGGAERTRSDASDRVSKLAKRLQDLIAMAENQNRGGARQEVRMAEDSAAARAEGQSAPTDAGDTGDQAADIDTLAREVTEQVTRELEMRRERRQEDPDGRSIWW